MLKYFTKSRKNDYSSTLSEAKYKSIHGEGLKILTSKEMFQRLSIALNINLSEKQI